MLEFYNPKASEKLSKHLQEFPDIPDVLEKSLLRITEAKKNLQYIPRYCQGITS